MHLKNVCTGTRSLVRACALFCLLGFACLGTAQTTTVSQLPEKIDESALVTLKGNTHPQARPEFDHGPVEPDFVMDRMLLVLNRSAAQESALETLLAAQYDPASPSYHKWLSPTQFGERFGPSLADIERVKDWLTEHGFIVNSVSNGRVTIEFSGTASQVEAAFHTEIHRYLVKGEMHTANASNPQIPAGFSPLVAGVLSLHDFRTRGYHHLAGYAKLAHATGKWARSTATGSTDVVAPQYGTSVNGNDFQAISPYDFATIYDVLPLWNATPSALDGTGVAIAIVGRTDIKLSDVATFRSTFGLPAKAPNIIVNGADPGTNQDDQVENTLDVEWSGAVAKGATIDFVTSKSTSTTDGVDLSEQYIVDNKTAPILSASFGACELNFGTTHNQAINSLWQQGAAEGISIFVASDDQGAAGCDGGGTPPDVATNGLQVNGLASTIYNVAVGGTDFNWANAESTYWSSSNNATTKASALGYIPETNWNDTCTNPVWDNEQGVGGAEPTCNAALQYSNFDSFVQVVGGGGGASTCTAPTGTTPSTCAGGYAKPSWQAGTGVPNDGKRDLPDISLFAATGDVSNSSYLICVTGATPDGTCNYNNENDLVALLSGGTSVSTPAMAGVMAIVDQSQGAAQGNPNPVFYALAKKQSASACNSTTVGKGNSCTFYDETVGTNAMPCQPGSQQCVTSTSGDEVGVQSGWSTTTGYDLATGLGSVNVTNLVVNWSSTAPAPVVSLSPTKLTFASTTVGVASSSQTVTLKNTGNATLTLSSITLTGSNTADYSKTTTCGSTLAAGATCTVAVTFKPTATGTRTASLSFADNAAGSAQTVALTGTGAAAPAPVVSLSTTKLTFASTTVGVASSSQTVTLKNTGNATLTLSSITLTGSNTADYSKTTTCGSTLAAAASCTVAVTFKPTATGTRTASLSFADNAAGSAQTVALTGTGAAAPAPVVSLSPTKLTFASTTVGVASSSQTVTLKNTGNATLTLSSITLTGSNTADYSKTTTCGSTLAAGASCTVAVTFKPTATGTRTASLSFADNAAGSAQTVALTGTGAAAPAPVVSLSPTKLTFASTTVGVASSSQTVTLKNTGNATLTLSSITLTGSNTADYSKTTTCGSTLAAAASCTVAVTFKPTATGTRTASLSFADNAAGSAQTVALTGTATSPVTLSPASLTFASTELGSTSESQTVTLTNTSTAAINVTGISVTGTNASSFFELNECPASLASKATCQIEVAFRPAATGSLSAALSVADSAAGSPQTVTLTGTGAAQPTVSLSPTSLKFAATTVGKSTEAQTIVIKNTSTVTLTLDSITLGGSNASSFQQLNTCGATLAAGASCTVYVAFDPAAKGSLTATLIVSDNVKGGSQTAALSGTGQ